MAEYKYKNPTSIFGHNVTLEGVLGRFEVVHTKSQVDRTKNKWFVSLKDDQTGRWWHSDAIYTKKEADLLCHFFYNLSDDVLEKILDDKVARKVLVTRLVTTPAF